MTAIQQDVADCLGLFSGITTHLQGSKYAHLIGSEALEDEIGRFRVWMANIGALQKGHSSLDYRLRDSPLLRDNTLKLLEELKSNLTETSAVLTNTRLPYEEQTFAGEDYYSDESTDDDESDDDLPPRSELEQRFIEIVDIIDNLYKISRRIRSPVVNSRLMKAATYRPIDKETGVDILSCYVQFDHQFTKELLAHLRGISFAAVEDNDYVVERLSKAITVRRQQFMYWKRHRAKLASITEVQIPGTIIQPTQLVPEVPRDQAFDVTQFERGDVKILRPPQSEITSKSLLSGTTATQHHRSLDEAIDIQSVTSIATTARDLSGNHITLPPPPQCNDKDFECPYCFTICPARYGRDRAWRVHLLKDLRPYVCTYKNCDDPHQIFRSQRDWSEHEETHRQIWRCPEHPDELFYSSGELKAHTLAHHTSTITESQMETWIDVARSSLPDTRQHCPICHVDVTAIGNLQRHLANHLERFAAFSLPRGIDTSEERSRNASNGASQGGTRSTLSQISNGSESMKSTSAVDETFEIPPTPNPGLSSEDLHLVPDVSESKLDLLMPDDTEPEPRQAPEKSKAVIISGLPAGYQEDALAEALSAVPGFQSVYKIISNNDNLAIARFSRKVDPGMVFYHFDSSSFPPLEFKAYSKVDFDIEDTTDAKNLETKDGPKYKSKEPILSLSSIPTLTDLFKQGRLKQQPTAAVPDSMLNDKASLIYHDITRLEVDAIVNATNKQLSWGSADSLSRKIHSVAGVELKHVCAELGGCNPGEAKITSAFRLPCKKLIHAVGSVYRASKNTMLGMTYRNCLRLAVQNNLKSIAFPCISTGGYGFPVVEAAKVALSECRDFLLSKEGRSIERIIFCVYSNTNYIAYTRLIPTLFPPVPEQLEIGPDEESGDTSENDKDYLDSLGAHVAEFSTEYAEELKTRVERIAYNLASSGLGKEIPNVLEQLVSLSERLVPLGRSMDFSSSGAAVGERIKLVMESLTYTLETMEKLLEEARYSDANGEPTHEEIWRGFCYRRNFQERISLLDTLVIYNHVLGNLRTEISGNSDKTKNSEDVYNSLKYLLARQTRVPSNIGTMQANTDDSETDINSTVKKIVPVHISDIPTLAELYKRGDLGQSPSKPNSAHGLNNMVCLTLSDITHLAVDAIVNSTDPNLSGGGILDATISRAAGPNFMRNHSGKRICGRGGAGTTPGYDLPSKFIIHASPSVSNSATTKNLNTLRKCYRAVLEEAIRVNARSVAFPALATGMIGLPHYQAAQIAIDEVANFLQNGHQDSFDKIIFCMYAVSDHEAYKLLLPEYFPPAPGEAIELPISAALFPAIPKDEPSSTHPSKSTEIQSPLSKNIPQEQAPNRAGIWNCHACLARHITAEKCMVCSHQRCYDCTKPSSISGITPSISLISLCGPIGTGEPVCGLPFGIPSDSDSLGQLWRRIVRYPKSPEHEAITTRPVVTKAANSGGSYVFDKVLDDWVRIDPGDQRVSAGSAESATASTSPSAEAETTFQQVGARQDQRSDGLQPQSLPTILRRNDISTDTLSFFGLAFTYNPEDAENLKVICEYPEQQSTDMIFQHTFSLMKATTPSALSQGTITRHVETPVITPTHMIRFGCGCEPDDFGDLHFPERWRTERELYYKSLAIANSTSQILWDQGSWIAQDRNQLDTFVNGRPLTSGGLGSYSKQISSGDILSLGGTPTENPVAYWWKHFIIRTYEVEGIRLLKLRNPRGILKWNGKWSDQSSEWTTSLREELDNPIRDNLSISPQSFWITFEDFLRYAYCFSPVVLRVECDNGMFGLLQSHAQNTKKQASR